jgi:peptidoglycan/LPS O-acetylase OafA/YrhL
MLVDFMVRRHWLKGEMVVMVSRSVVSFVLTVAVAALSYRFFESFFLRLKERFSQVKSRPVESKSELAPS